METTEIFDYKEVAEKIGTYSFKQLTEAIGINEIFRNDFFIVLNKGTGNFIVFLNSETNHICLYDLNMRKLLKKDELVILYYHLITYDNFFKSLESSSLKAEFVIFKPFRLEQILGLYFGNFPRSRFPETYSNFNFQTATDNWFNRFITYNIKLKRYSLPMFNNNSFGVSNFVDFIDNTYSFRFTTAFSMFYVLPPSNGIKPFSAEDSSDTSEVSGNHLIITFNPFNLIESHRLFNKTYINYYPVILEPYLTSLKFLEFNKLVDPFNYDKIILLYSNESIFYKNDLINAILFILNTININNPDYYLEYDISSETKITILMTRYPSTFNMLVFNEMFEELNEMLNLELSGKNDTIFSIESVLDNIKFLSENGFNFHYLKSNNSCVYFFDIPMKVETTVIFMKWLIKKFDLNIELSCMSGLSVFE